MLVLLTGLTLGYSPRIHPIPWLSSSLHRPFRSCPHLARVEARIFPYNKLAMLSQLTLKTLTPRLLLYFLSVALPPSIRQ